MNYLMMLDWIDQVLAGTRLYIRGGFPSRADDPVATFTREASAIHISAVVWAVRAGTSVRSAE